MSLQPTDPKAWNHQIQIMRDFNNLIARPDVNPGNTLIDGTRRVWFIDSTRAFGKIDDRICPAAIELCERRLFQRLPALDSGLVREEI